MCGEEFRCRKSYRGIEKRSFVASRRRSVRVAMDDPWLAAPLSANVFSRARNSRPGVHFGTGATGVAR